MSTLPTLIAKAKAEQRPIIDLLRAWGDAGCPEFGPGHPFWAGTSEVELESFEDWRELKAATAQLNREAGLLSEPDNPTALFDAWKESTIALTRTLAENQKIGCAEVFVKALAATLRSGAEHFPERFAPAVAAIDELVKMLPAEESEFMGWARCGINNTADDSEDSSTK